MDAKTSRILFALLRSAVCNTPVTKEERLLFNEDMLPEMMNIAKKHDVINILAFALKKNGLINKEFKELDDKISISIYRYIKLDYELKNICNALETAKIPFIPLKGSVIREYYPEPWMRTSADIDVLIHDCDIETAKAYFTDNLKYKYAGMHEYEASFYTASGCHVELHFNLIDNDLANSAAKVLDKVWDTAIKHNNYEYWCEMSGELFYFYHIAHMAKHFEIGGCGIRPFIDLYILNHNFNYDRKTCDSLFADAGLTKFSKAAELLSEVWFNNAEHTDITYQMQDYILRGGVFGTHENEVMVQKQKLGGKYEYILYKIFIPYKELKKLYPILEKHRWLTPIMEIRRWFRHIFVWRLKRAATEFQCNNSASEDAVRDVKNLFQNIGL